MKELPSARMVGVFYGKVFSILRWLEFCRQDRFFDVTPSLLMQKEETKLPIQTCLKQQNKSIIKSPFRGMTEHLEL